MRAIGSPYCDRWAVSVPPFAVPGLCFILYINLSFVSAISSYFFTLFGTLSRTLIHECVRVSHHKNAVYLYGPVVLSCLAYLNIYDPGCHSTCSLMPGATGLWGHMTVRTDHPSRGQMTPKMAGGTRTRINDSTSRRINLFCHCHRR